MLFNSLAYFAFLLVVLALHWAIGRRARKVFLLGASYFFYGCWDWRFLTLIWVSTLCDYLVARRLGQTQEEEKRKRLLKLSLAVNLGLLGFFKYFDFFTTSFAEFGGLFGVQVSPFVLDVVLPVGISFYTFQTLGYTIDVFRGRQAPVTSLLDFSLYVCFFPQLVAGPIERPQRLIPQIVKGVSWDWKRAHDGVVLCIWGLFLKVVIADNLAPVSDQVFDSPERFSAIWVLSGVIAFAFQILCDFEGYSKIARGSAKLLGYDLATNFENPYFARNPSEFWRRWHVSLSQWLRDYLYVPLGGNRSGVCRTHRNLMLTMLLGGLWHGASWTFVVWGGLHGLLLSVHRAVGQAWDEWGKRRLGRVLQPAILFGFTCFAWIFFRAVTIADALDLLKSLVGQGGAAGAPHGVSALWMIPLLLLASLRFELIGGFDGLLASDRWSEKRAVGLVALAGILLLGVNEGTEFLYFQF